MTEQHNRPERQERQVFFLCELKVCSFLNGFHVFLGQHRHFFDLNVKFAQTSPGATPDRSSPGRTVRTSLNLRPIKSDRSTVQIRPGPNQDHLSEPLPCPGEASRAAPLSLVEIPLRSQLTPLRYQSTSPRYPFCDWPKATLFRRKTKSLL